MKNDALQTNDYRLNGKDTIRATQRGLAEATWYTSPVPKARLHQLHARRDGPAIRDTLLWFALIIASGLAGDWLWQAGSLWAAIPFLIYGTLYASTSDSRWHESSHGTAFKTDWMNNALYEISSFMVMRESVIWRWSHARHHSDTIIVGRDPEIVVPRPPNIPLLIANFFGLASIPGYFRGILLHSLGRLSGEEKTFVPESEHGQVFFRARVYFLIYAGVIGLAASLHSLLPLIYIGLPTLYGSWLMPIYGYTQHAGLAENVLDHRLNCRTVYLNPVNRFLYWNMNYHTEHHMFPLVPYHHLPDLHEAVRDDLPTPYTGLWAAWRELVPAVLKQVRDPAYYVERKLPATNRPTETVAQAPVFSGKGKPLNGWLEICAGTFLKKEDVIRVDHEGKTFAVYRIEDGTLHATDGMCTHGNAHLATGHLKGKLIECPKHNGRFDITDGSPQRRPACRALLTYAVREEGGKIFLSLNPLHHDHPCEG